MSFLRSIWKCSLRWGLLPISKINSLNSLKVWRTPFCGRLLEEFCHFLVSSLLVDGFFETICFSLGVTGGWLLRSRQNRACPATGIVGLLTRGGLTQAPTEEGGSAAAVGPRPSASGVGFSPTAANRATLFCTLSALISRQGNVNFEVIQPNLNCVSGVVSAVPRGWKITERCEGKIYRAPGPGWIIPHRYCWWPTSNWFEPFRRQINGVEITSQR